MIPQIDRYTVWDASGNVAPEDREELYRGAPITAAGYVDLVDAIHRPDAQADDIQAKAAVVAEQLGNGDGLPARHFESRVNRIVEVMRQFR